MPLANASGTVKLDKHALEARRDKLIALGKSRGYVTLDEVRIEFD